MKKETVKKIILYSYLILTIVLGLTLNTKEERQSNQEWLELYESTTNE